MSAIPLFLINAMVVGGSLTLMTGPLGSFIVWRRMSFLGDTLAHTTLLGVATASLCRIAPLWGMIGTALILALFLVRMHIHTPHGHDSWLAIVAHSTLAVGLLLNGIVGQQGSLVSILFGDLLAVSLVDVRMMVFTSLGLVIAILRLWPSMLLVATDRDLASLHGINVVRFETVIMVVLALSTALACFLVGVLLVTALMIIPAVAAQRLARSPEAMAAYATLIGILSVVGGLIASLAYDLPASPSIVTIAVVLLVICHLLPTHR